MQSKIARHSNKMLVWHAATTNAVFSSVTGQYQARWNIKQN